MILGSIEIKFGRDQTGCEHEIVSVAIGSMDGLSLLKT